MKNKLQLLGQCRRGAGKLQPSVRRDRGGHGRCKAVKVNESPAAGRARRRRPGRAGRMDCSQWWVLAAVCAVTVILHALFLAALYLMLSRKIERLGGGSGPAAKPERPPTPAPTPTPTPAPAPAGEAARRAAYAGSSDTSSETSDDSDSGSPGRQGPRSEESLSYTSVRFAARGRGPAAAAARDYENVKTGTDYVNVDPKKKKADFWACSSPVAAKSVEYTEVKL
ncbi:regulator of hemoglobinization and erythroid cell expansion protein [Struthio camelus]|uniref:regulator of hemoglobinization and erythroid cell expansion protein n=1 Tax=Struthio camelus TaxID=8801 RepID=UPI003603D6F6